jgi:hypothetical protein
MITASLVLLTICLPTAQSDEPAEVLRAIRTAYMANRAALTYGEIRFEMVTKNPHMAGARSDSAETLAKGYYAYDGPVARYETVYPAEVMAKSQTVIGKEVTSWTVSQRLLTDGKLTLWDRMSPVNNKEGEYDHAAQVNPGTDIFYQYFAFILELGVPGRSKGTLMNLINGTLDAEKYKLKSYEYGDKGSEQHEVLLTFESETLHARCWVDLKRGAIPRRISITTDKSPVELLAEYGDIRWVGDKAWLPYQWTVTAPDGFARIIKITECSVVKKPDPTAFRLDFEKPIPMLNSATSLKYPASKSWDLRHLPSPHSPGVRILERAVPSMPLPAMASGSTEAGDYWWRPPLVISALVLLAAGGIVLFRRRSHAV